MKDRLFNKYEAQTEQAYDLIEESGLKGSLANIIRQCVDQNLSLRDASIIVQSEVYTTFGEALLREAMNKRKSERTQIIETQQVSVSITRQITL
jgi:hypothetical protein